MHFNNKPQGIVAAAWLLLASASSGAYASYAFEPAAAAWETGAPVDEPLGARSALGLTLWHLGHDVNAISDFHHWLEKQKIVPESLLPNTLPPVPDAAERILIEPELLPENRRNGWRVEGNFLTSGAGDAGPDVDIPLHISRSGFYRAWIRFEGNPHGVAVTSFRIYRAGREHETPLVSDEIYDLPVKTAGLHWKELLIDLPKGDYTVRLGHITRWWHVSDTGYLPRNIDCLYLTDEVWDYAPEAAVKEMRALPVAMQRESTVELTLADKNQWKLWQVRPVSWEARQSAPKLFDQSYAFWRARVDELSKQRYSEDVLPNYREPVRQNIFDDEWNMIGNPVRVQMQKEALAVDIVTKTSAHTHYWLRAGDFQSLEGQWARGKDGTLTAGYGDFAGSAKTTLAVDKPGKYHAWVRSNYLKGYFAPWRAVVCSPDGSSAAVFSHDQKEYASEWQRIGAVEVKAAGAIKLEVAPMPYMSPGTYRIIREFLVTTDETYVPQGSVRPPLSVGQYESRMSDLGAKGKNDFVAWLQDDPYRHPLSQELWSEASWPPANAKKTSQVLSASTPQGSVAPVVVLPGSKRALNLGLRNMGADPLQVEVECGPLQGGAKSFGTRATWRVIAFVPYGSTRQTWSPFALLRRPWVKIPARGVAGLWLTLDARDVPPGQYSMSVTLKGNGVTPRILQIPVHVPNVAVSPARPVLVGGYTNGPEGTSYQRNSDEHGLNVVWNTEMSKAEMQKRSVSLLLFAQWDPDEDTIRRRIARFKKLGLDYSDWAFTIRDEPVGATAEKLKDFIDVVQTIRQIDPQARISFNPGESAVAETFEILDPLCDLWLPYVDHVIQADKGGQGERKRAIFMRKPWLWYTTPCYWDKAPDYPARLLQQISSIPSQRGNCLGTAFFAYYYPLHDAWDTAYEHLPDASVHVLPSRHGAIATPAQEAIAEGIARANLAQRFKDEVGDDLDEATTNLLKGGSTEDLAQKLSR